MVTTKSATAKLKRSSTKQEKNCSRRFHLDSSSIYFITIMAACRCYSVTKPFQYRANVMLSKINKICFGAWCFALVLAVMPLIGWGEYEPAAYGQCRCSFNSYKYPYNWFIYCLLTYVIPIVLNSVFLIAITKTLQSQRHKMKAIRINRARNVFASFKKSQIDVNFPREKGVCHVIGYKEEVETSSSTKSKAFQRCENVQGIIKNIEVHRNPSDSQESPTICLGNQETGEKVPKVKIRKSRSSTSSESNDGHNKTEERNEENFEKAETRSRQEFLQPHQESAGLHNIAVKSRNENQADLESKDERRKGENKKKVETMTHCQLGFQQHLESITFHPRNAINGIRNENHLESIVKDERCSSENEENLGITMDQGNNTVTRALKTQHKQVSKDFKVLVIALVFSSFVVLCSPTAVVRSWYALSPDAVPLNAFNVVDFLGAVNSLANPFLCALLSKEIRSDIKKLYCALWAMIMSN
ncbi:hypothetical protein AC249_AIPGENE10573 [Exaiptasia diaphana]|nr:hypothetical protein AC249_AIPGENE10573 [Exaiptasia diaphana]